MEEEREIAFSLFLLQSFGYSLTSLLHKFRKDDDPRWREAEERKREKWAKLKIFPVTIRMKL